MSTETDPEARERAGTRLVNRKHVDASAYDTVIGRSSRFGNPYKTKSAGGPWSRENSVRKFAEWFGTAIEEDPTYREAVEDLRGQTLACYCVPLACHGDVILDYLAATEDGGEWDPESFEIPDAADTSRGTERGA